MKLMLMIPEFELETVFNTLYKHICNSLILPAGLSQESFVSNIQRFFRKLYQEHLAGLCVIDIHRNTLTKYTSRWTNIRSTQTCFVCLRRAPQIRMKCEHCICENCSINLGQQSDDMRHYSLQSCPLCKKKVHVKLRIHPSTAGIGILCVDGGGVRGVIPTTILEILEDRIGLPLPIQDHFQMAYGISAGLCRQISMSVRDINFTSRGHYSIRYFSQRVEAIAMYTGL